MKTPISLLKSKRACGMRWNVSQPDFLAIWFLISLLTVVVVANADSPEETGFTRYAYYQDQVWDSENKEYSFVNSIQPAKIKEYASYYLVYFGEEDMPLYSKKYLNQELATIFYFNSEKQLTHFYYFSNGKKKQGIFYYDSGIKSREIFYDALTGEINQVILYHKDGTTPLKKEIYDHASLRKTIIYYNSGEKRSETEYFEGRKTYYDRSGKVTMVKRFRPRKMSN